MKMKLIRIFSFMLILNFFSTAHAMGSADDIPFALNGFLTIVDTGPYNNNIPILGCDVVMSGRTNSTTQAVTITSIAYSGRNCQDYLDFEPTSEHTVASMTWTAAAPTIANISNIYFNLTNADCRGNITAMRVVPDQLMIKNATVGTCTINGTLRIISTPGLDYSYGTT